MENHEKWLQEKAFEFLSDAFNKCPPEIIFCKNLIILVPKYFNDFIDNGNPFQFYGQTVEIGYENQIVFFDKENGFAKNRIFKYKL